MESSFEFFYLPLLVQSKVFRQYLSAFFKVRMLSQIEELDYLSKDSASWLIPLNESSISFLSLVARLEAGFYLSKDDSRWWKDGFHVQIDEEENLLKFAQFQIDGTGNHFFCHKNISEDGETFSTAAQFLELFSEKYERYLPTEVEICIHPSFGMYVINFRKRSVYWTDEECYQFQDGCDTLQLPVSEGGFQRFVTLTAKGKFVKECHRSGDGRKKRRVSSPDVLRIPLNRWLLNGKWGNACNLRFNFELEMKMVEEECGIAIRVEKECQKLWSLFPTWEFTRKMMDC